MSKLLLEHGLYGVVWHNAVNEHRRGGDCIASKSGDGLASRCGARGGVGARREGNGAV